MLLTKGSERKKINFVSSKGSAVPLPGTAKKKTERKKKKRKREKEKGI
jgi:hypothetical protein